ncbi:hypothetical protein SKA34_11815 [Photobacterium sp. SKA34]|nr:hypothetical protein [Photobacterium sp. SKA34]EAR55215.1 hypothetical protein SKA34_11815 [Photobacterium sp. SKA34]
MTFLNGCNTIQNYSAIFFAMLWAITGIGIAKAVKDVKEDTETTQTKAII